MIVLTGSASVPLFLESSHHGDVHCTVVYIGLYLAALGSGIVKPCTLTFGADQFDINDTVERAKKGSFFSWYYFTVKISALLSGTVLVWLQDNVGWGVGFVIPTVIMLFSLIVFVASTSLYRFKEIGASPLRSLFQVIAAAVRKRHLLLPDDSSLLYELTNSTSPDDATQKIKHTDQFRYFNHFIILYNSRYST